MYLQHGDCLLHNIESIPKKTRKVKGACFHKGLNHSHDLTGSFSMFTDGTETYLKAGKNCKIIHGEHKPILIPPGLYRKGIVREYDHHKEESRQVID